MNEKFLNLILFLIDELQKDEKEIIKSYQDKGIDLEAQKRKLLDKLREKKLRIKKENQLKFLEAFKGRLNSITSNGYTEEDYGSSAYAIAFRRNNKEKRYELTEEDKKKLKVIEEISKDNG